MTASRLPVSAEAATEAPPAAPPPAFPMWPFAYLAYFEHCSLDCIDYVDRLSKADDPAAMMEAKEALGLNLLSDMQQTLYALIWAPFRATLSAGTRRDV